MALDRQRIISELGSVMNQLQSADCGCMGKLFGSPAQCNSQPCGGYQQRCCGGGRGMAMGCGCGCGASGDPYAMGGGGYGMGMAQPSMSQSGMGMGQSGMGMGRSGMGMGQSGMGMGQSGMGMGQTGMGMGQSGMGQTGMGMGQSGMGQTGMGMGQSGMGQSSMGMGRPGMGMGKPGMGIGSCDPAAMYANTYGYLHQNLMKPVMEEVYTDLKSISPSNTIGNSPLAAQMGLSPDVGGPMGGHGPGNSTAVGNIGGQMNGDLDGMVHGLPASKMASGGQPMMGAGQPMMGQGQQINRNGIGGMGEQIMQLMTSGGGAKRNPQGQGGQLTDQMTNGATNSELNPGSQSQITANMQQQQMNGGGMRAPQIASNATRPLPDNIRYGKHAEGMKKFSEFFPGVSNGDLGFDPMSLAIQMNPENVKSSAMETIKRAMGVTNSRPLNDQFSRQQLAPSQQSEPAKAVTSQHVYQGQQQVYPATGAITMGQQQIPPGQQAYQDPNAHHQEYQGQVPPPSHGQDISPSRQVGQPVYQGQQQQVYAANDMGQQPPPRRDISPSRRDYQIAYDNPQYQDDILSNSGQREAVQQQMMYKDPIFPAEKKIPTSLPSNHKYATYYNTLGQPCQLVPQTTYKAPGVDGVPLSLSWPDPKDPMAVKQTVSKTSITRMRPLGNEPSLSQMRHYYRCIKGKESKTNLKQMSSSSDGKIRDSKSPVGTARPVLVEKIGGDTLQIHATQRVEQPDSNKKAYHEDVYKGPPMPVMERLACRKNGLQDRKFGDRYLSNSWSLYGRENPQVQRRSRGTGPISEYFRRSRSPSHPAIPQTCISL